MQETMQKSTAGTNLSVQYNYRTTLAQRNNTIQLMALIHHQFCSPRFVDTCKYAWYKAGYIPQRPPKFQTPLQYSFGHKGSCSRCDESVFIRCAWCGFLHCFLHFWQDVPLCQTFNRQPCSCFLVTYSIWFFIYQCGFLLNDGVNQCNYR